MPIYGIFSGLSPTAWYTILTLKTQRVINPCMTNNICRQNSRLFRGFHWPTTLWHPRNWENPLYTIIPNNGLRKIFQILLENMDLKNSKIGTNFNNKGLNLVRTYFQHSVDNLVLTNFNIWWWIRLNLISIIWCWSKSQQNFKYLRRITTYRHIKCYCSEFVNSHTIDHWTCGIGG